MKLATGKELPNQPAVGFGARPVIRIKFGAEQQQSREAPGGRVEVTHLGLAERPFDDAVLAIAEPFLEDLIPSNGGTGGWRSRANTISSWVRMYAVAPLF